MKAASEMKNFIMFFTITTVMFMITITVFTISLSDPAPYAYDQEESWRDEAMFYIDRLILAYDDKPDVVKAESVTSDPMYCSYYIYLYSNKSLNKLRDYIENSSYVADYTEMNLFPSPPSDVYVYVDEHLVGDNTHFFYYAPDKMIYFAFDEADALEFQEYLIEIINTTD
jgi:hypothetical protein